MQSKLALVLLEPGATWSAFCQRMCPITARISASSCEISTSSGRELFRVRFPARSARVPGTSSGRELLWALRAFFRVQRVPAFSGPPVAVQGGTAARGGGGRGQVASLGSTLSPFYPSRSGGLNTVRWLLAAPWIFRRSQLAPWGPELSCFMSARGCMRCLCRCSALRWALSYMRGLPARARPSCWMCWPPGRMLKENLMPHEIGTSMRPLAGTAPALAIRGPRPWGRPCGEVWCRLPPIPEGES